MRTFITLALLAITVVLPLHSANAYTLTLNGLSPSGLSTLAYDAAGGAASEDVAPAALPYLYTSASIDGAAAAEAAYDLADTGFLFTLDHTRVGSLGSFAQSYASIFFSVDQNTDYVASGAFSAVDPDGRKISLSAFLYDYTLGAYVFNSGQESQSTPNESFTLGLGEGDLSNLNTGSLTGTLIAGHDYQFNYSALVHADPSPSPTNVTATGFVSLELTAFPEPTTVPPDPDRFLTYFNEPAIEHSETADTSAAYHAAIDPNDERLTLDDWLVVNGMNGTVDAEVIYVNEADLGFGRHMFIETHPDGRVASYVKNHTDDTPAPDPVDGPAEEKIQNAHDGLNLLATVAMEYGPPPGNPGGASYTRFYAFGADGNRILGADLDGRGEKFIPGVCTACHGGNPRPLLADGSYPDAGDTGAGFLPWDLDTFGFSDTLFGGLPLYDRASQEAALKTMNEAVLATNPTDAAREVIEGWYGGPGTPNATFDGDYVPPGWVGHEDAYLDVYAPNCRACHVMRNPAVSFRSYSDFVTLQDRAQHLVFDRGIMPLARRTYGRFWNGLSVSDPSVVDLFGAVSTTRRPGSGVPFAFAGSDRTARVGVAETLDATKSSHAATFAWTPLAAPAGSTAALDDPAIAKPSFTPDLPGTYIFLLTASNAQGDAQAGITITATPDGGFAGVDFASEVLPVFEARCQSCHDGTSGPDFDGTGAGPGTVAYTETVYRSLMARASAIDPTKSLMLQKPTTAVTHGGGLQLDPAHPDYALLLAWITQGVVRVATPSYQQTDGTITNPILEYTPVPFSIVGNHPYSGPDLEPLASLANASLASAILYYADLSGADLSSALLNFADLFSADLSGATLTGADLSGAFLTGADLGNAIGVTPGQIESLSELSGISLANLELSGIDLSGRNLGAANLSGANLTAMNLSGADAQYADFRTANLTNANLTGATLAGADFDHAVGVTTPQIESAAALQNAKLTHLDLGGIDLSGRYLQSVDLSGTNLAGANLAGADVTNGTVAGVDFSGADLSAAIGLAQTTGIATYDAATDFSGTGFDPVGASWTLIAPVSIPAISPMGIAFLLALILAAAATRFRNTSA